MNSENQNKILHSAEHVLQMAMAKLYPNIQRVMGPAIENGFYFDFDLEEKVTNEDLPKIEAEMQKFIDQKLDVTREEISLEEARELFKDNKYKLDILDDIEKEGTVITIYRVGEDLDLCAGPHVTNTSEIKAFKLLSLAGAYYKGDENNKMLTRIYGTAFGSKEELKEYLELVERAKEVDHRRLGKQLDLFCFSDLVGPGLPMYTPRGTIMKEELQRCIEEISKSYGYKKVITPHLAKIELYEKSGHATKFADELFHVTSNKGHEFVMKPVQCPHQTQIYASSLRSYRDLPIRYMESEKQYRAEKPGEVGGLNRVYAITIEDGHAFCTVEQVKDEIKNLVEVVRRFYEPLGLWGKHWVSLSVRDYGHPEKYIGEPKDWDDCERILQEVSDEIGLNAKRCEGEAALYGPKLDFMFRDSLGKEIQIPTIQIDFATPQRFELTYIDEDGNKATPVMVHRAILGSYERMMALIIEHFGGSFPVWLSPVQVQIIPINDAHIQYAREVSQELEENGIRTEIDSRNESMGAKIRDSQMKKEPYMLIVGDKEVNNNTVSVRLRTGEQKEGIAIGELTEKVRKIYLTRSLELW